MRSGSENNTTPLVLPIVDELYKASRRLRQASATLAGHKMTAERTAGAWQRVHSAIHLLDKALEQYEKEIISVQSPITEPSAAAEDSRG